MVIDGIVGKLNNNQESVEEKRKLNCVESDKKLFTNNSISCNYLHLFI